MTSIFWFGVLLGFSWFIANIIASQCWGFVALFRAWKNARKLAGTWVAYNMPGRSSSPGWRIDRLERGEQGRRAALVNSPGYNIVYVFPVEQCNPWGRIWEARLATQKRPNWRGVESTLPHFALMADNDSIGHQQGFAGCGVHRINRG